MFRNLIAAFAALCLVACTSLRPLPEGPSGQWRGQVKVGDDVSVVAANGKTYLLTLTEVDGEKIVGIGDNKKVTIRYEQIESLELRKLSAAKTAGLSAGVLAAVAVVVVALAAISFQAFINDQDGDGE